MQRNEMIDEISKENEIRDDSRKPKKRKAERCTNVNPNRSVGFGASGRTQHMSYVRAKKQQQQRPAVSRPMSISTRCCGAVAPRVQSWSAGSGNEAMSYPEAEAKTCTIRRTQPFSITSGQDTHVQRETSPKIHLVNPDSVTSQMSEIQIQSRQRTRNPPP